MWGKEKGISSLFFLLCHKVRTIIVHTDSKIPWAGGEENQEKDSSPRDTIFFLPSPKGARNCLKCWLGNSHLTDSIFFLNHDEVILYTLEFTRFFFMCWWKGFWPLYIYSPETTSNCRHYFRSYVTTLAAHFLPFLACPQNEHFWDWSPGTKSSSEKGKAVNLTDLT